MEMGPQFEVSSERQNEWGIDLASPGLVVLHVINYTNTTSSLRDTAYSSSCCVVTPQTITTVNIIGFISGTLDFASIFANLLHGPSNFGLI